jgi:hypothetical protein
MIRWLGIFFSAVRTRRELALENLALRQQLAVWKARPRLTEMDRIFWIVLSSLWTAVFPGFRLAAPLGVDAFLAAHVGCFPGDAQGLRTMLELCAALNREVREFPQEQSLRDVVRMPKRFPRLFRYHKTARTIAGDEVLADFVGTPPSA